MRRIGRAALALTGLLFACSSSKDQPATDDENALLAQDGSDANAAESHTESMTSTFITAAAGGGIGFASSGSALGGGHLAAEAIGDGLKAVYVGCKTPIAAAVDANAKKITYTFDDCSGPYGLLHVTGVVTVTYDQPAPTQLNLDLSSTGLVVNRTKLDWHATGAITASGTSRSMVWKGSVGGTTARGRAFSRTNEKTIGWEAGKQCVTVNGASEGDVTGRKLRTEVSAYTICESACPEAGGSIKITSVATGKTVSLAFDGSNTATYTGPNGGQVQVRLACGL
jgi:hypothetical protein